MPSQALCERNLRHYISCDADIALGEEPYLANEEVMVDDGSTARLVNSIHQLAMAELALRMAAAGTQTGVSSMEGDREGNRPWGMTVHSAQSNSRNRSLLDRVLLERGAQGDVSTAGFSALKCARTPVPGRKKGKLRGRRAKGVQADEIGGANYRCTGLRAVGVTWLIGESRPRRVGRARSTRAEGVSGNLVGLLPGLGWLRLSNHCGSFSRACVPCSLGIGFLVLGVLPMAGAVFEVVPCGDVWV